MHYADEGSGDPVVMVHGNPSWSCLYRELISALADEGPRGQGTKGPSEEQRSGADLPSAPRPLGPSAPPFRCLAPDHIGCGLSDKPSDAEYDFTLAQRVADLEYFMDALGLHENVTLVVHDWGGMIGLAAALRRPQRIARLVVFNTAGFLLPQGAAFPPELELLRNAPWLATPAVLGGNLFARCAARWCTVKPLQPRVRELFLAPYDSWNHRRATLRFVQDIPITPADPSYELAAWVDSNLHRLDHVPTLICWGMQDFIFGRDFLAEWRRRRPDAEIHEFENAGHYLLEDEGPAIIARVRDFLVGQASPPAASRAPLPDEPKPALLANHMPAQSSRHATARHATESLLPNPDRRGGASSRPASEP
jgi:haloalkane dehalogenase